MTDFGKDISCTSELRPGRYATGVRIVAEAAYRRLTTPKGVLRGGEEEADYGMDLTDMIGSASTPTDAAALGGRIKAELTKDERILDCTVDVVATVEGPVTSFQINISAETTEGPFDLTLAVDDVSVELLGLAVEES